MPPLRSVLTALTAALLLPHCLPAVEISEILPENEGGLQDADLGSPGWVELHNETATSINLAGWHLTDNATVPAKWTFPAVTLAANGYLVVFASGKDRAVAGSELHTNFQLDPGGEFLALVRPDLSIAQQFAPQYPKLRRNVSFGVIQAAVTTPLIAGGATLRYIVPADGAAGLTWTQTAFNDSAWSSGAAGLGYDSSAGVGTPILSVDFNARSSNIPANTEAGFQAFIIDGSAGVLQSGAVTRTFGTMTVTLQNSGADSYDDRSRSTPVNSGAFTTQNLLRDFVFSRDQAGTTGLDLTITGLTPNQSYSMTIWSYDSGSPGNRVSDWTANGVLVKNDYTFDGNSLPATDSQYQFSFDTAADAGGKIVVNGRRDPASNQFGVFLNAFQLSPFGYGPLVVTNVSSVMKNANASLYARKTFTVTDPATVSQLRLKIRYDDGFVAWINGQQVAARNAPGSLAWNSAATADRTLTMASAQEEILIPVTPGLLVAGTNVMAIQGLNDDAASSDFLLSPVLEGLGFTGAAPRFYATPTPGAANSTPFNGIVADTHFSVDRGFFSAPFATSITCATPGAQIRYTTDGSPPAASTGTVYDAPVNISTTTVLRAAAFLNGWIPSNVDAQTYLFLSNVANQPASPPGWPATWGTNSEVDSNDGAGTGIVPADYQMDPAVTANTIANYSIADALKAVPSMSLSLAPGDFLGPSGIYQNPQSTGTAWERACAVEFMDPSGAEDGFHETCKIEIHGNSSRRPYRMQKHSFRLSFTGDQGASRLRYRFFKDTSVKEFNKLVLRGCFTDSWGLVSWDPPRYRPDDSVYFRDMWVKYAHRDLGYLSPVSRFVHLYVNGLYWGLYNVCERVEQEYFSDYLGGRPTDWEVVDDFVDPDPSATSRWKTLFNSIAAAGSLITPAAYQSVQQYVDVKSFADYYLLHVLVDSEDWPHHNGIAARNKSIPNDPYRWLPWDQEIMLDNHSIDRLSPSATNTGTDRTAGRLYQRLRENAEFRLLFADRAHLHLHNDGKLNMANNQARWQSLASQIDKAIVAESARWGDTADETPYGNVASKPLYTREADWLPTVNMVRNTWIPSLYNNANSYAIVRKLQAQGLYPATEPPALSQHGGNVPNGYSLAITAPAGMIYYTLDGSDPRQAVTGTAAGTLYSSPVLLTQTAAVNARALNGSVWSALTHAVFIVGTAASSDNIVITEVMYNPPAAGGYEFIELMNIAAMPVDLTGVSFPAGISYTFGSGTLLAPGQRIVLVADPVAFAAQYPGVAIAGTYSGKLDNNGEQIVLSTANNADIRRFTYNDKLPWPVAADGDGHSMTLIAPLTNPNHALPESWRPSVASAGSPGAGDAIVFTGSAGADTNGDGLSDLLEYALSKPFLSPVSLPDGTPAVVLTRNAGTDTARVIVESSTDLNGWSELPSTSLVSTTGPAGGVMTETWTPLAGTGRSFIRARVELR